MSNPAHIAQGMGPVCAAKLAARLAGTSQKREGYPVARYRRIERALSELAAMWSDANRALAETFGEGRAEAQRRYDLVSHWCRRGQAMERRARALLSAEDRRALWNASAPTAA